MFFKGSDWLCKVVELSMQYCGQIFEGSFETYKTILRRIFTEFDHKVDFQNHLFGWIRFENRPLPLRDWTAKHLRKAYSIHNCTV